MADTPDVHIGENSPEQVAYKLMLLIGNAEKKSLTIPSISADREWILRTYSACLGTVKQPHRVSEWLGGTG